MDGQVKEARVEELKALELELLHGSEERSIVHELKKFVSSTDIWRVDNINLKHKGTFPAVMVPDLQAEVDIFMSSEFYLKHIFKGTPPLKIEGLVKGLFPIETNPGELTDISPDKIFLEGHGLVISGLPYHLMVNERTRNYLPKQEREFMKETDKKRKWVNREQFSKLEWFEEYNPAYNTCEGFKEEKRRELKEREREIDLESRKKYEKIRERDVAYWKAKREKFFPSDLFPSKFVPFPPPLPVPDREEQEEGGEVPPTPSNGTEERKTEKREKESFSMESLPPKGALTQKEKKGEKTRKGGQKAV